MKLNYLILNLLTILFNISFQKEYLVSSDFVNPNSNQTPGWSLPTTTYYCSNTLFSDWSGQKYYTGVLVKGQTQTKTISQLPPHWSLSVRFDLLLSGCVDSTKNDVFKIYIDNNLVDSQTKNPNDGLKICIQNAEQGTCNDELVLYQKNITHSSSSVTFSGVSQTIQDRNVEGFCFKNFYLYIDTCDISCATCSGPTSNQCLTCPANSTLSSNTCTCKSGYIQHQYQCVSTCPTGYVKSKTSNICIQDYNQNCASSDAQSQMCTSCSTGYLYQGYCVASCPQTSTLSSGVCVDFTASLINGSYLLSGLFNNYFGQSEILGLGLIITNFKGLKSSFGSSGALTTNCGTNHILGGFWLSGSGATISRSWTGLAPHWSIRIGYTLWKIDQWNNQNFILSVDGSVVQQIPYGSNVGTSDLCGFNNQLDLFQNQIANFTHSSTTLTINFSNSLSGNVGTQSFGLSNLYVLVDYCTSNCITCGASGCLACQSSYFLYNNVCVTSCPSSTYFSNPTTCVDCNSNCKTCNSPGNICTSCYSPNFLNPGNGLTCLATCPVSYWPSTSDQICKTCDQSCYTCISPGGANNCTSCSGSLYLYNSQCISQCPIGTYSSTVTNNNQCLPCNSSCKTCSGPNSTDCLSCSSPNYLQPLQNSCVSSCNSNQFADNTLLKCINCDITCTKCSGPNNNQCLKCSGSYYFDSTATKCVKTCPDGTYPNSSNNICSSCNSNCTTCSGPASNSCLSCSGTLYLDSTANTCVSTCPNGYYANSQGNICSNCNSSCTTCSGPADNNCLSCSGKLYFNSALKNCVSTCPSGTYSNSIGNICSPCNPQCATCSGGNSNNCLSCQGSLFFNSQSNSCVSPCPDGYYANSTGNLCSTCDPKCKTCSGNTLNNCLSCSGSLYLYGNTCVADCPSGKYQNTNNNTCSSCNSSCTTCSGPDPNNCLSCSNSLYLNSSNNTCVSICPNGTYQNSSGNICSACHTTCATCSGPLINNCLTCSGSLQLNQTTHTCTSSCPSGTYSSSGSCSSCNPNCFTCYGSQSNNCLSCTGTLYFDSSSNSCTNNCPIKTFADISNNTCSVCDSSCTKCSGPNQNNCSFCQGSLYLNQANNTCISVCPIGTYSNISVTLGNICSACHSSCTSCSGPNSNNCLSCSGTLYFDSSNNTCTSICPDGTYQDSSSNCSQCNSTCATCEGSASFCKSCSGTLFLDESTNSCNPTCPQGTYQNAIGNICTVCDPTCTTCSGPNSNDCLSCSTTFYFNANQKTCVESCPPQTYANAASNICSSCNSSCLACNGPASNNCIQCSNSLYLNQSSNQCVSICPQGTFPDGSTNICSKCDLSCFTCSGPSSSNCLSCSGSLFLSTSGNECKNSCKTNEFQNNANNQCTPCDSSCLTCNGNLNTNCLSCSDPLFLQQSSSTCIQKCDSNQYGQITPQRTCLVCDSTCATCSGPNQNNCLSCSGSKYLDLSTNQCVTQCPSGTFNDNSNNKCSPCNTDCKTCSGPNNNQCLSCSLPKYFQKSNGMCLENCNSNQFKDNGSCTDCDASCAACSGADANNCLKCSGSLFLNQNTNTCVSSCPDSYYQNTSNNTCSKCDITCATCNGGTSSNCLTCNSQFIYQKSTSKCISSCPSGQYLNTNTNNCEQCDATCLNCVGGSKNQCVDCQSPRYYQKSTTSCELQCQPNYYGNSYTALCEQCDASCATCSGPNNNQCLSCKNSLFLLQASGTCVSNCPNGYSQNNLLNQCQKCDSSCKECSGTSNTQCTSCISQLILFNNQCLSQCPSGYFISQSSNQCVPCDQSCESCSGQLSSNCLSCKPGTFLISNQCISKCPDGYFQNNQECSQCHPSCKTCVGPNSNQCQTCFDLLIKYNSSCIVECPKQMYMTQTPYKQCIECNFYCSSGCSGPTKEDCNEIKPIYQIIVYILISKSFIWVISIIVGFLKDNAQQILPLQKVAPLKNLKENEQDHINNNQLNQKDKNLSLIEFQQNDPNLSPHSKIEDFNADQGSKSPNIPINQRGSIMVLPQTNNNLMQSKNYLTFNNEQNEEDKSPQEIGRKRRSRKIDFILRGSISNSPQKGQQTISNLNNMKSTILDKDQKFFPQDQTTANRSLVSISHSPTKRNLFSQLNDTNQNKYSANEKLKYSFVIFINEI
ncbi:TNFR/NGFR cysteine-rich region family protein (macronuclear) [Tetrahymena thermophila SB210]|uniref:TNFR/NGFR cysteine-rich region family protein n=1 Tax=Tetrahymena thermophila (strain SB210) TaxID=312017 RepID=I7ME66_TETTS|nr:TNFR/NGFR cysteine-rich region family protein [Tetrahymena thermophila SB210]EAR95046.2 TNFR/NGFR cysteine-rich region family protein [Tetrahymena thermophila SB210]|eukprot:XP_001015291.2 TNFR/NGFR cysteine-rich region family protein [Tetrahymena thermophila SB210]